MINQIRKDLETVYPKELAHALLDSYVEIKEQYYLGKHEPSELNGGKFVEACVRILQRELTNSYVPLGTPIRNMAATLRGFENHPATYHESFRLHIPRALLSIYNIRNRRGVGHLGGDVNANPADATLIATTADWIMAEIYRMFYSVPLEEAQGIVNDLVRRKLVLIHDVGEMKRVLAPFLSYKDQTLLLLASTYPQAMSDKELISHLEHSNPSVYRKSVLRVLHKARFMNYSKEGVCVILPPGLVYVERYYTDWLQKLNQGGS